jgi:rhomboid family GlyGly-CTERM serine protease
MRALAVFKKGLSFGRGAVVRVPWLFIAVALIALLCQCHPAWRPVLLYDRAAIAGGQWWRLWTGHVVHFGWPHFVTDTGLWVILGFMLGGNPTRLFPVALFLVPAAISAAVYFFAPDMMRYGGLSAVDLTLLLFVAGRGWQHNWKDWFWPAVLVIYVGEIVFEATLGQGHGGGMIRFDDPQIHVATSAHIAAAACAVPMLLLAGKLIRKPT